MREINIYQYVQLQGAKHSSQILQFHNHFWTVVAWDFDENMAYVILFSRLMLW